MVVAHIPSVVLVRNIRLERGIGIVLAGLGRMLPVVEEFLVADRRFGFEGCGRAEDSRPRAQSRRLVVVGRKEARILTF